MSDADPVTLDTVAEAESTPQKAVRRWLMEISLAEKREKDWRKAAKETLKTYRGQSGANGNAKKNSFNVLWANTEIMRPALYNSAPKPDVRRRFRQKDMLGKAVGEVMERSLTYCTDAYDMDNCLQNDVLDALLPGRGLSRVRYVPKFKGIPAAAAGKTGEPPPPASRVGLGPQSAAAGESEEPFEGDREEVEYEQALCEHVQWDDFLHGPGKTWEEVQWVAFKARLTRDDLIDQFGKEIGEKIDLDAADDDDLNRTENKDITGAFKRAAVWEIWDKEGERVFFICKSYKKDLIYPTALIDGEKKGTPPLKLKNFFPVPRPLQLFEDTGNLVPQTLYSLYKQQAEELDRISTRINKIVDACKVRFVYDAVATEFKQLMESGDNDGIPAESARAWMTNGGLEKAIWWMPVQQLAVVLKELYLAREQCKATIYEITGISDVLRGATDPNETLGAQQLKASSSSLRIQRMQREVQRYSRDLLRLLAEVIGEQFDPQTLAQMTGLNFPTQQQKMAIQLQAQAMQQQAQANSQAPPPPQLQAIQNALQMPTWEEIMAVLRSDMQREYRVDVETDSTVAQSLQQDMAGLKEVLTSVVELFQGLAPAVTSGALSMDAAKAMVMSVVRRARMGLEVEDALESGMQQPKPAADPNAAKAQAEQMKLQQEQQAQQNEQANEQIRIQAEQQKEALIHQREVAKMADERQAQQLELQHAHAMDAQQKEHERIVNAAELEAKYAFERWKVEQDNATKIAVAEISAKSAVDQSLLAAEQEANEELTTDGGEAKVKRKNAPLDRMEKLHSEQMQAHGETMKGLQDLATGVHGMAKTMAAPKRLTRGPDGRAVGVESVQ